MEQRDVEIAVSMIDVADKAMSLDASFHGGNYNKVMRWTFDFMKRHLLYVRTSTCRNKITSATMQYVQQDFSRRLITWYSGFVRNPRFLVNMDEKDVYLNCSPNRAVHPTGEKTLSIMVGGTSSARFTLAVAITMDGTKFPLFVTF